MRETRARSRQVVAQFWGHSENRVTCCVCPGPWRRRKTLWALLSTKWVKVKAGSQSSWEVYSNHVVQRYRHLSVLWPNNSEKYLVIRQFLCDATKFSVLFLFHCQICSHILIVWNWNERKEKQRLFEGTKWSWTPYGHPPAILQFLLWLVFITHTHHVTTWRSKPDCDLVSAALPRETGSICACISCHNRKRGTAPPDKSLLVCSAVCLRGRAGVCVGAHFVPDKCISSKQKKSTEKEISCSSAQILYRIIYTACSTAAKDTFSTDETMIIDYHGYLISNLQWLN